MDKPLDKKKKKIKTDKPYYPHVAIASIDTLARTLGVNPKRLISISENVDSSYTQFELKTGRIVFEPKFELKKIQKRINSRIFENVVFPYYLMGGIKSKAMSGEIEKNDETEENVDSDFSDEKENSEKKSKKDIRDYVSNASSHTRAHTLINLDIKKFYTNIKAEYVFDIYKYFFKFPDDVAELLVKLTTFRGRVPQGGCTSSYLANLVFFNTEYRVVSDFRNQGISYTRLLDDVALSSKDNLSNEKCSVLIKKVVSIFRKYDLKLNTKKTRIEYRNEQANGFEVTGLWVGQNLPKLRKKERRYVRQLVYNCELQFASDPTADEYHELWNKTSGKVAKLARLGHPQASALRSRLKNILPKFSDYDASKIEKASLKLLAVPIEQHNKLGRIRNYNKMIFKLGILARTHKNLARKLKRDLKEHYSNVPTMREYWHG